MAGKVEIKEALLKCEESFDVSGRGGYETESSSKSIGFIEFKDTPEFNNASLQSVMFDAF